MIRVIIKGKSFTAFEVFNTKIEAFARRQTISNNVAIYKTDDKKYALFIRTHDVTMLH